MMKIESKNETYKVNWAQTYPNVVYIKVAMKKNIPLLPITYWSTVWACSPLLETQMNEIPSHKKEAMLKEAFCLYEELVVKDDSWELILLAKEEDFMAESTGNFN